MATALSEGSLAPNEQLPSTEGEALSLDETTQTSQRRPSLMEIPGNSSSGGGGGGGGGHAGATASTMEIRVLSLPGGRRRHDRERKIGHRRVDQRGQVTYKKKPTLELMAAIQLGIGQSITNLSTKPRRDLLLQDFIIVETVFFPGEGSNLTPAHHYSDFRFKTYAPVAFRYFRELFGIQPDDFLLSMCNDPLNELINPGASGSIFYITDDDEFIIKTVQHKEAEFLQKLLPGYYMNLNQNPRTLLPKFYGLFCYQLVDPSNGVDWKLRFCFDSRTFLKCGGKNIRFIVMNNLLPSGVTLHEKYDLKGSTYKRRASRRERAKKSPTLKDLDFVENHPDGILLEADTYSALVNTIQRDCRVLQSFQIMDYSLLMGIHNLDQAARQRAEADVEGAGTLNTDADQNRSFSRGRSMKQRLAHYSTAMEAIHARTEPLEVDDDDIPLGGIPARNSRGERLFLFIGIIDILQSYRIGKKLEHAMKSMLHDGDTISVHRPGFYSQRFQTFFADNVFKKIPSSLKQSPSKKRSTLAVGRQRSAAAGEVTEVKTVPISCTLDTETVGDRPDILPAHGTPPPTFGEAIGCRAEQQGSYFSPPSRPSDDDARPRRLSGGAVTFQSAGGGGAGGVYRSPSLGRRAASATRSPALSLSESTPTQTEFTEGTPSYTMSSPSCSSAVLDTSSPPFHSPPPPGDGSTLLSADQVKFSIDLQGAMYGDTAREPNAVPANADTEVLH